MAHPKRRHSSTRRDKRRTHYKISAQTISICPKTSEPHLRHRAYVVDGNLMLHGNVVIENYKPVAGASAV